MNLDGDNDTKKEENLPSPLPPLLLLFPLHTHTYTHLPSIMYNTFKLFFKGSKVDMRGDANVKASHGLSRNHVELNTHLEESKVEGSDITNVKGIWVMEKTFPFLLPHLHKTINDAKELFRGGVFNELTSMTCVALRGDFDPPFLGCDVEGKCECEQVQEKEDTLSNPPPPPTRTMEPARRKRVCNAPQDWQCPHPGQGQH